jgi:hypothetical protein
MKYTFLLRTFITNGKPKDTGNIGHKTQHEDKQNKNTTQTNKRMSNTDSTAKSGVNQGPLTMLLIIIYMK